MFDDDDDEEEEQGMTTRDEGEVDASADDASALTPIEGTRERLRGLDLI